MADKIYQYTTQDLDGLLQSLEPTLPHSLPIYRRIQLALTKREEESAAFATFPPHPSASFSPSRPAFPFAVGFLDHSPPDAIAFIWSSIELDACDDSTKTPTHTATEQTATTQLLRIFAAFRTHRQTLATQQATTTDTIILVCTVHARIAAILRTLPAAPVRDDLYPPGGPYGKYIFRAPLDGGGGCAAPPLLPPGLRFDAVREAAGDHAAVVARNELVRSAADLRRLPHGVGVRDDATGALAAWAFVGVDGCVRTLHVRRGWRRRGLGRAVALEALRGGLGAFGVPAAEVAAGRAWAFADAAAANEASVALFKGLGGRWTQDSFWIRVDLARVAAEGL